MCNVYKFEFVDMTCILEMGCILIVEGLALSQTKSNEEMKDRHTHIINNKSIYTAPLLQVTAQKRSYKGKTSKNAKGKDIKCII